MLDLLVPLAPRVIHGARVVAADAETARRAARQAYMRAYYLKHRERILARVKAWDAAHPEQTRARKQNRARDKARARRRYLERREALLAARRRYYWANRDRILARKRTRWAQRRRMP